MLKPKEFLPMKFIIGFFIIFFTSCGVVTSPDKYFLHVTMERDGKVTSYAKDELSVTSVNKMDDFSLDYYFSKYNQTNITIDKDTYNFYVVIPIKTKQSLNKLKYMYCVIGRDGKKGIDSFIPSSSATMDKDGYYHYLLYTEARILASIYYLNDIKDAEIYFDYDSYSYSDSVEITSNKLTIPKEEFEYMLERLAISHERLSFQPEGY